jgi:hypothetical protein
MLFKINLNILKTGYGDIVPNTVFEAIFVTLTMLMANAFFSYFVGSVTQILADIHRKDVKF